MVSVLASCLGDRSLYSDFLQCDRLLRAQVLSQGVLENRIILCSKGFSEDGITN
jgi:hypothetical protein